jgi:hypothetical protein
MVNRPFVFQANLSRHSRLFMLSPQYRQSPFCLNARTDPFPFCLNARTDPFRDPFRDPFPFPKCSDPFPDPFPKKAVPPRRPSSSPLKPAVPPKVSRMLTRKTGSRFRPMARLIIPAKQRTVSRRGRIIGAKLLSRDEDRWDPDIFRTSYVDWPKKTPQWLTE